MGQAGGWWHGGMAGMVEDRLRIDDDDEDEMTAMLLFKVMPFPAMCVCMCAGRHRLQVCEMVSMLPCQFPISNFQKQKVKGKD